MTTASKITQTASHWGVYRVATSASGQLLETIPLARDPDPPSMLCGLPEIARSELRIGEPHVREGYLRRREKSRQQRGADPFVAVGWDTALDLVESELQFWQDGIYEFPIARESEVLFASFRRDPATHRLRTPIEAGSPGSLEKHGNPNVVTADKGTSRLAQSSVAQTVLVEVERCLDPPPVTAFDRPALVGSPTSPEWRHQP
jgi:hypothetical protein